MNGWQIQSRTWGQNICIYKDRKFHFSLPCNLMCSFNMTVHWDSRTGGWGTSPVSLCFCFSVYLCLMGYESGFLPAGSSSYSRYMSTSHISENVYWYDSIHLNKSGCFLFFLRVAPYPLWTEWHWTPQALSSGLSGLWVVDDMSFYLKNDQWTNDRNYGILYIWHSYD